MTQLGLMIVGVMMSPILLGFLYLAMRRRQSEWRLPHSMDYDHNWYARILAGQREIEFGGHLWIVNLRPDRVLLTTAGVTAKSDEDLTGPRYRLGGSTFKSATILAKKIELRGRLRQSSLARSSASPRS